MAFFQYEGNFLELIDKLCVSAGTITGLISLTTLVSMRSRPKELELLRSKMILSALPVCNLEREKEQVLLAISG